MLNISDEVKTAFMTDSTPKILTIHSDGFDISTRNFFTRNSAGAGSMDVPQNPDYGGNEIISYSVSNGEVTHSDAVIDKYEYGCVSVDFCFTDIVSAPTSLRMILYEYSTQYGWQDTTNLIAQKTITVSEYIGTGYDDVVNFFITFNTSSLNKTGKYRLTVYNDEATTLQCGFYFDQPMLSFGDDLSAFPYIYIDPTTQESWDDSFLNENFDIDNDHLLSESFSLNESLCSEHNIKFGLCEAAYCQFTVTDDYHDFKDREIKPFIKVNSEATDLERLKQVNLYDSAGNVSDYYPYPGQELNAVWSSTQLSGHKWVNNDMCCSISEYAKQYLYDYAFIRITFKAKLTISSVSGITPEKIIFATNVALKFDDDTVDNNQWTLLSTETGRYAETGTFSEFGGVNKILTISELSSGLTTISLNVPIQYSDYLNGYLQATPIIHSVLDNIAYYLSRSSIRIKFLDANNKGYSSSDTISFSITFKDLQINFVDSINEITPEYSTSDCIEYNHVVNDGPSLEDWLNPSIPLGVFTVTSVKKNHTNDILKQEITAYDNLVNLEQNAADWYTNYMFGIDFMDYTNSTGFQFARQIYSTLYNYLFSLGVFDGYVTSPYSASGEYDFDVLWEESLTSGTDRSGTAKVEWSDSDTINYPRHTNCNINYVSHTVTNPDTSKLYFIHNEYPSYPNIDNIKSQFEYPNYDDFGYSNFDPLYRGLYKGNVLVEQTLSSGSIKGICVDSDDYFMLDPSCTQFTVYVAVCIQGYIQGVYDSGYVWHAYTYVDKVYLGATKSSMAPELQNGSTRLVYYNYGNKDIFACDSSIAGRDVVRSLLEINGCFFRLSRYTGKPEFIYCNKSGLYPRNDLYPADDLYPRLGTNLTINMSQYQSFIQEDYTVQRFGKIQILKKQTSNTTKSVVEWEYVGDEDFKNAYLIEDNIFYCNEDMIYDYDAMPEVSEMLEGMWLRIANMDYTPSTVVCKGMPWIECGDRIACLTKTGGAETFIYHRTLKGIQSLTDTFESEGDEYNEEVNDYGYKEWEGN